MQTESSQPVEEAHVEAIGLNNAIEEAKELGNSIHGQEAVADAMREASGTQEAYKTEMAEKAAVFKAEWEREHIELQEKQKANDLKLLDGLLEIISSIPGTEKVTSTTPVESGKIVPDMRPNIPIAPEDVTPEMLASQAKKESDAQIATAAAESVAAASAARAAEAPTPVVDAPIL